MLFISCNDGNKTAAKSGGIQYKSDTIQYLSTTLTNTSQQFVTGEEQSSDTIKEKQITKKQMQIPGVNELDSVAILESKILYDADFKPSVYARIKNNMGVSIVAFELLIDPNNTEQKNCEKLTVTKKLNIPSHKSVIIKEKLQSSSTSDCGLDFPKISLGDFVLSNGKKTNLQKLFWENINKK